MSIRNRLLKVLGLALLLPLTSCGMDLGVLDDDDGDNFLTYYGVFKDIKAYHDHTDTDYELKGIVNDYTLEKFEWEDKDDEVETKEYLYIVLPLKEDIKIETIVLFFLPNIDIDVEMNLFYFADSSEIPENIKYRDSPDTKTEEDEHGEEVEVEIEYDDPDVSESLFTSSEHLTSEDWVDVAFEGFHQEGYEDGYLHAEKGGYIYLRMENNSGFNRDTMEAVSFSFMNLIIRAV